MVDQIKWHQTTVQVPKMLSLPWMTTTLNLVSDEVSPLPVSSEITTLGTEKGSEHTELSVIESRTFPRLHHCFNL